MRPLHFLPLLLMPCTAAAHGHDHGPATLQFHLNRGQWPGHVLYKANTAGGALFVERAAFTHLLISGGERAVHGQPGAAPQPLRMHAYRVHFEGGGAQAHAGEHPLPHYVNYFLGNDPAHWAGGVPVFAQVGLQEVWPGIGLRVDGHHGLKYDWLVAPGADPARIVMRYEGQDALEVRDGLLWVHTTAGNVVEQRPVAWQEVHGQRRPVECRYVCQGDRVRFDLPGGHDPRYPLVIDPVVVFSSFSGSTGDNFGFTATYDSNGHLYGGGMVRSTGYPVTPGVLQGAYGGGENDIAISKFTPTGNALVWSTYIGGSANEVPHSMVTNSAGELFVLGTTNSSNFPVTQGCWDSSFNGGTTPPFSGASYGFTYTGGSDIVVVHLNAAATALIGSTFVGGTGNDGLNQTAPTMRNYGDPFRGEVIVDADGNPMVATTTTSSGLFTSAGAPQASLGGGQDAYLFRMDPGLTTMLWATYFGGAGTDAGYGIQVSANGEIFVTGGTTSSNLPAAGAAAFPSLSGGVDGFIARFHPSGTPLLARTYLGTSGYDQSYFVQLDTSDDVFVVGQTTGPYPVTPGLYANPNATQFIHKLSTDLSTSIWSTRIGGAGSENISPTAFLVSNCGQIYFSGWAGTTNATMVGTSSTNGLPVTPDAFQSTTNGSDFYLMMLEPEASSLGYATFFGGSSSEHVDGGTSRFDKNGIVYQAVCAGCQGLGYPTTPGVWSNTNNSSNCNLGVFKMDFEQAVQVGIQVDASGQTGCLGAPFVFNAVGTATSWTWDMGDGTAGLTGAQVVHTYQASGVYTVMLVGVDPNSCNLSDTAYVEVNVIEPPIPEASFQAEPSADCQGFSVALFNTSTGATSYFWQFGDGGTSTQTNPVHTYPSAGEYTITLTATDAICGNSDVESLTITLDPPSIEYRLQSPVFICPGATVQLDAGPGYDSYNWSPGGNTQVITATQPGPYIATVTEGICVGRDTVLVVQHPTPPRAADVQTCPGQAVTLSPTFPPVSILWNTGASSVSIQTDLEGNYWFAAVDSNGCTVRDTIRVTLIAGEESLAFVPNVFSPNGDGMNDIFSVGGLNLVDYRMEIFNRWGMLMYETTDPQRGWNGNRDNLGGEKVPDGTYFYIITYRDLCSTRGTETFKGHVTLLR